MAKCPRCATEYYEDLERLPCPYCGFEQPKPVVPVASDSGTLSGGSTASTGPAEGSSAVGVVALSPGTDRLKPH